MSFGSPQFPVSCIESYDVGSCFRGRRFLKVELHLKVVVESRNGYCFPIERNRVISTAWAYAMMPKIGSWTQASSPGHPGGRLRAVTDDYRDLILTHKKKLVASIVDE